MSLNPDLHNSASAQSVYGVYRGILQSWNQRDAAAMAAHFAEDGNMVGFDGSQVNSRAAIEAHLAPIFADHPTAAYAAKIREIRLLADDVALLRAVAGMIPPGANDIKPELNTIHTLIAMQSENDVWQAALFQSTPAAWHGRSTDRDALTKELQEVMCSNLGMTLK